MTSHQLHGSRGCGADGRRPARRHAERRREQREGPGELEVGAEAPRDAHRATIQARATAKAADESGVDEVQHVVVEGARGLERGAERALDERAGRRADRHEPERVAMDEPQACASAAEHQGRHEPGARALQRHGAGRSGPNALERREQVGPRAPRLADLAGDRVARARGERRRPSRAARLRERATSAATIAANAARPVFAMALPGPRRPPRASAMPSTDFRFRPSRLDDRRREERGEQHHPASRPRRSRIPRSR